VLDGLALVAADLVVAPQRLELGTETAEFIDERLDLGRRAGAGRVHPERAQYEPRHAFPVVLGHAGARVEEEEAEDVALFRRQRSIVHQHDGRRPVPGDDVPYRCPDQGGAGLQRVENALQPRRDASGRVIADLGGPAQADQEEVLPFDIGQHESARDPVEHVRRRRAATPLLEPRVPGRADVGALRHFLAAQAGRAATLRRQAEGGRIELPAAVLQIEPEPVLVGDACVHPVSHYNGIISLLYYNSAKAEVCLQRKSETLSCVCL
jgi:hypothetical protein